MKIQAGIALVFDMDGVILDSNPTHREAWRLYNRRFGIETDDEAMQQRMYGRRNDEIVRDFFGAGLAPEEIIAHGAAKESLYREMMRPRLVESLVPGVTHLLQNCNGTSVGLATNAERANVDFLLDGVLIEGVPLRNYFRAVVDGQQVSHPKPHPDIYLRVAELLGADPRNCIVFEDSHTGVQAARAAGARVVGLLTTHKEFKNIELSVDDFRSPELEKWLEAQKPVE
jgi:beta-phosphoglucomutase